MVHKKVHSVKDETHFRNNYTLGLRLYNYSYERNPNIDYKIVMLVGILFLFLCSFEQKFESSLSLAYKEIESNESTYYPSDLFNHFTSSLQPQVISHNKKTNHILSLSNLNSFSTNVYLNQSTISVAINENTFNSYSSRRQVCDYLIYYSLLNNAINETDVDQTKLYLYYYRQLSFYGYSVSRYTYYYDNKYDKANLYGGYNASSMLEIYLSAFAEKFDLPKDTIKKYFLSPKAFELIPANLLHYMESKSPSYVRIQNMTIPILQYSDVKAESYSAYQIAQISSSFIIPIVGDDIQLEDDSLNLLFWFKENFIVPIEH